MDQSPDTPPAPQTSPGLDQGPQSSPTDVVDTVAGLLEQLDELPVGDHVAVFERAHESLRAALNDGATAGPAARA